VKISDDLLSDNLILLFNELKDKIDNTGVKNKFKIVTQIILYRVTINDSFVFNKKSIENE
jgi:hypothetical protein